MFCHGCGTQVDSNVQFCPRCGASLVSGVPGAPGVPLPVWTPPAIVQVQSGHWIGEGWNLVKADMGNYVILALIFTALTSVVPIILQGPMIVGLHIFTMKKIFGRRAEIGDMFKGFDYFVPSLVASLVIGLLVGIGTLFCLIPGLVLTAMYTFTYLFILDKKMDFWPAMQASHAVVKHDYVGFTLFVVLLGLVGLLGVLCCIVGILVAMPVIFAAITVAYKEIVGFEPRTVDTL